MKLLCLGTSGCFGVFLLIQLIKYRSVICLQYKLIKSFWRFDTITLKESETV